MLPLVFRKKLGLQTLQQNEHAYRYKAPAQYHTGTPECVFTRPATVCILLRTASASSAFLNWFKLVYRLIGQSNMDVKPTYAIPARTESHVQKLKSS